MEGAAGSTSLLTITCTSCQHCMSWSFDFLCLRFFFLFFFLSFFLSFFASQQRLMNACAVAPYWPLTAPAYAAAPPSADRSCCLAAFTAIDSCSSRAIAAQRSSSDCACLQPCSRMRREKGTSGACLPCACHRCAALPRLASCCLLLQPQEQPSLRQRRRERSKGECCNRLTHDCCCLCHPAPPLRSSHRCLSVSLSSPCLLPSASAVRDESADHAGPLGRDGIRRRRSSEWWQAARHHHDATRD